MNELSTYAYFSSYLLCNQTNVQTDILEAQLPPFGNFQ